MVGYFIFSVVCVLYIVSISVIVARLQCILTPLHFSLVEYCVVILCKF